MTRKIDEFYMEGKDIASTQYEGCNIVQDIRNKKYSIRVCGSYEDFSDDIKFCPFCGGELNKD